MDPDSVAVSAAFQTQCSLPSVVFWPGRILISSGLFWFWFSPGLVWSGSALVWFWFSPGLVLVQPWSGLVLVQPWSGSCSDSYLVWSGLVLVQSLVWSGLTLFWSYSDILWSCLVWSVILSSGLIWFGHGMF